MRRISFLLLLVCGACGPSSDPPDTEADGSSSGDPSTGAATTTSSGSGSSASDPGGSAGSESTAAATTSDGATDPATTVDAESGAPACDEVVPGDWNRCWTGASYDGSLCNWTGDPSTEPYVTCLMAALVENGSVCIMAGCEDRCDCFAPPTTGTATVECMDGIIVDEKACVLYCGDGQTCPDGMVCGYQICVWEPK